LVPSKVVLNASSTMFAAKLDSMMMLAPFSSRTNPAA